MRNKTGGFILGALQLAALFQAYNQWLGPFLAPSNDVFSQFINVLSSTISFLLLLLPLTGLYLIYREKRWGYLFLAAFPLVCIVFGITALPLISLFYGSHLKLNALFIAWVNALVCSMAFWFFVSAHSRFRNNSSVSVIDNSEAIEHEKS